jgi:hypothetical protein
MLRGGGEGNAAGGKKKKKKRKTNDAPLDWAKSSSIALIKNHTAGLVVSIPGGYTFQVPLSSVLLNDIELYVCDPRLASAMDYTKVFGNTAENVAAVANAADPLRYFARAVEGDQGAAFRLLFFYESMRGTVKYARLKAARKEKGDAESELGEFKAVMDDPEAVARQFTKLLRSEQGSDVYKQMVDAIDSDIEGRFLLQLGLRFDNRTSSDILDVPAYAELIRGMCPALWAVTSSLPDSCGDSARVELCFSIIRKRNKSHLTHAGLIAGLAQVAGGHAESVDFAASKSFTAKWMKDNHGEVYQLQLDGMREQVDLVKYAFDNAQEQKKLKTQITGNSTTSIFDGTARVKDTNMPYR